jgi:hypothetical protein
MAGNAGTPSGGFSGTAPACDQHTCPAPESTCDEPGTSVNCIHVVTCHGVPLTMTCCEAQWTIAMGMVCPA